MKNIVIEQLTQRGLTHLFNEKDFKTYKNKISRQQPHANAYFAALQIFDMFILNGSSYGIYNS
jgi:hypothetical protein